MLSKTVQKFTPVLTTALRSTTKVGAISSTRFSSGTSKPSPEEEAFNKEFTQKDYDEHAKEEKKFEESHDGGKSHIKYNTEGFKDLQDKGEKTAQEQERPEDFM